MWFAAIKYIACCEASISDFKNVFRTISQWIDDVDQVWTICMRVKRGIIDTSLAGGMCKDQVQMAGSMAILRNMNNIDFDTFWAGKLSLEDLGNTKTMNKLKRAQLL